MVYGYKAFNLDRTNRYGMTFEDGKTYSISGDISFGNDGNGFHMCTNLEDVFRYFDGMSDDISVARVVGFGNVICYNDEYNGYYDMYSVQNIKIESFLTREEIINTFLDNVPFRVCRFVSLFRLSDDEIKCFRKEYSNETEVMDYLSYYQEGKRDTFYKRYVKERK